MNFINELSETIINFVFLFQLFFISIYVSRAWRESRRVLLTKYPQSVFPNLYARDELTENKRLIVRKWLDYAIFVIGLAVLLYLQTTAKSPNNVADYMLLVALLQLSPMFVSAYWCNQNSRLISNRYPKKRRTAQLTNHTLFDFISLRTLIFTLAVYFISVGLVVYMYFFAKPGELKSVYLIGLSTAVTLYIFCLVCVLTFGKKKDHFIEQQERMLKLSDKISALMASLGTYTCFVVTVLLFDLMNLNQSTVSIVASIFAQAIVFTTRNQYYPINPSVYKE